jgi:hypothetical protein
MKRKFIRRLAILSCLGMLTFGDAAISSAQPGFGFAPGPPPPMRRQFRPARPGPGFVWQDGFWSFRGSSGWAWTPGLWVVPPSPGVVWAPGGWHHARNGWRWHGGSWRGGGPRRGGRWR